MIAETVEKRSRGRAYLLLARVSNLPTVWSNVLAGLVAGSAIQDSNMQPATLALLLLSASAFYTGGMFLNDAFDAPFDSARASRAADASRRRGAHRGVCGRRRAARTGARAAVVERSALLAGVAARRRHRLLRLPAQGQPVAPLVMGACRGLVYLMAAGDRCAVGGAPGGRGG